MNDEGGAAVRPLVHVQTVESLTAEGEALRADDRSYAVQSGTIRDEGAAGGPYDVFAVDSAAEGPEQVIAVRRR